MSVIKTFCIVLTLAATTALFTAGPAAAQWHHRHHHYHRGGGFYFGFGAPYAFAPRPYYYGPAYYGSVCRWERVRFWRHGRWHWRSVRRCY